MKLFFRLMLSLLVVLVVTIAAGYAYLAPSTTAEAVANENTRRATQSGEVIGYEDSKGAHVWQGIPFARAPVGNLRWKAPRPTVPWSDTFAALSPGNECASLGMGTAKKADTVAGSEDCLFLNIFAPMDISRPLPVMFWIHGGANTVGSGSSNLYNGSKLANEQRVVVVTINYRLGPFGWFTHPALRSEEASEEDNSGNYGTLDQIHALKWVRDNISAFGGDPAQVTIFGESAGGWNVLAMMASPLAKGLFKGAIVQSGRLDIATVSQGENFVDDPSPGHRLSSREIINTLLLLDSSSNSATEAKSRQLNASAAELAGYLKGKSTGEIFAAYRSGEEKLFRLPDLFGDGAVLPSGISSEKLFANPDNYNAVPVVLGTNLDEMKLFLGFNPDLVTTFFGLPTGIKDLERYNMFNRYATDEWKVNGVDRLASAMRDGQGDNVFAYRFDAKDLRHLGLIDLGELFGAAHALEIPYVFGAFTKPMRLIYPERGKVARLSLSSSMMSYWGEFAYNGDPGKGRDGALPQWSSWENDGENTPRLMILDSDSMNGSGKGIRMSPERITLSELKQRLFTETRFKDQTEYCEVYKTLFRGGDFVQHEYETLGTGCTVP
ncbi:MAG: para-nitrobenzyl esterase [Halioglobus sp.]|jgi:para-nitrobenzyl esterase